MCGIVGMFCPRGTHPVDPGLLRQMRDALRHRGPDDGGEFIAGALGLAHRRLSIIDVAGGHQPLGNEDGSVQIVYNGEVYNFHQLHREAEAAGHRFATRSDTETIVHLYEDLGDAVVERLSGMFAFALWDGNRRRLLLARDRAGIKPLYYAWKDGRFAFASEVHPLLRLPWVSREIDPQSLDSYLDRGYVPAPRTMFRDVHKLPAAHRMVVDTRGVHIDRYWMAHTDAVHTSDEAELSAQLVAHVDRSVSSHLVSDVPVGAFLSGGLDSSIVVALMRRHHTGRLKTFSVAVQAAGGFDESEHAKAVAHHLGTEHHEIPFTAADVPALLQTAAHRLDEPVSDPAALPTYVLAQLARQSVTVVLTGEGADETWAGYDVFRKAQLVAAYRRLPEWLRRGVSDPLLRRLPGSRAGARLVEASEQPSYLARLSHFDAEARRALYTHEGNAAIAMSFDDDAAGPALDPADPFGSVSRDLIDSHLAERLLVKVDRMTMAHSLEARVPYLDHALVEFALSVPGRLKLRGGTTKYLLRRAFRDVLPASITQRPKHNFDFPCAAWLRTTVAPLADEVFADQCLTALIDADRVNQLWRAHRSGAADHTTQIWALMTLQLWARSFTTHAEC